MARTLDGMFTKSGSLWSRSVRNVRLLMRIVAQMIDYFTKGTRVRRSYRAKESRGEVHWLD